MECPACHEFVTETAFFCPGCGEGLRSKVRASAPAKRGRGRPTGRTTGIQPSPQPTQIECARCRAQIARDSASCPSCGEMVTAQSMKPAIVPQLPLLDPAAASKAPVVMLDPPHDLRVKRPQPQWEYTFAEFTYTRTEWRLQSSKAGGDNDRAKLGPEDYSKWMGLEGWELVNVVLMPGTTVQPKRVTTRAAGTTPVGTLMLVFKRPKL